MADPIREQILKHVRSTQYSPQKPRQIARTLEHAADDAYPAFREALRDLMHEGRVIIGQNGTIVPPTERTGEKRDELIGTFRQNRKGFGFVIPTDTGSHEDLYIPEEGNPAGAITGDVVRAKILSRGKRDGKAIVAGRIIEVIERKNKRFVGSLDKKGHDWFVMPDGNTYTEPIYTPDAGGRYIKKGTKVVVEITEFPTRDEAAMGVITEVLGDEGAKDVDLRTVIVHHNLPDDFPDEVKDQASAAHAGFDVESELPHRYNAMTDQIICTIDPDDAKDYDDAISLTQLDNGEWELGVHIADVSHFVKKGTPLDLEAYERGNSTYFPGYVIPMLPEVLSNGVCSLQEGVPRLCKSAFIVFDRDAKPIRSRFSNTIIKSAKRLRYREAQAIIDQADVIPHPEGDRKLSDYDPHVIDLLHDMDDLAKRIQQRRHKAGQLVLNLPQADLILNEEGKVVDAKPEDQSFTHTLIEMFMVEANEAVARLLDSIGVPFIRRTHPEPESKASDRLKVFLSACGHKLPSEMDRFSLQALLASVKGKPEGFAVNLAILRSLTRAEYSPKPIGHFALASTHYAHFTSPIRRYADLTVHRLLDAFFEAAGTDHSAGPIGKPRGKVQLRDVPTMDECVEVGKHISYTERRSQDAERELRQIKLLELMQNHVGEQFMGVITGVTNFGLFIQLNTFLIEGLNRYTNLLDDWWDVDEKAGMIKGQRTGQRIRIGDVAKVLIARVDLPRRELDLQITEVLTRGTGQGTGEAKKNQKLQKQADRPQAVGHPIKKPVEGATKRSQRSKQRDRRKGNPRR
jgi:ribonuclease R